MKYAFDILREVVGLGLGFFFKCKGQVYLCLLKQEELHILFGNTRGLNFRETTDTTRIMENHDKTIDFQKGERKSLLYGR